MPRSGCHRTFQRSCTRRLARNGGQRIHRDATYSLRHMPSGIGCVGSMQKRRTRPGRSLSASSEWHVICISDLRLGKICFWIDTFHFAPQITVHCCLCANDVRVPVRHPLRHPCRVPRWLCHLFICIPQLLRLRMMRQAGSPHSNRLEAQHAL